MQNKIQLKPYQTSWESDYQLWLYELSQLLDLPSAHQFEHMGSTAIPGIFAKPTIDILLGVEQIENFSQANINSLEKYGFDYVEVLEREYPFRRYFQLLDEGGNHLVHLHVVTINGNFWHQHLLFKNYLLTNPFVIVKYSEIKKQALDSAKTRDNYTAYKTKFIFDCLRKAFVDLQLNPPLAIKGNKQAFQPQAYMTDIIAQLYNSPKDLDGCIAEWDRFGKGGLWWQDAEGHWYVEN
mgnify:CR=1 FL=1